MGKLFVIDGTDGSGKQTQFQKLQERLTKDGIEYKTVSFPNYDSPSSSLVKMYLSGEFGKNAKDDSIEFTKEFCINGEFVKVAVRISTRNIYYARSLYVLNPNRVKNFIAKGTLKQLDN